MEWSRREFVFGSALGLTGMMVRHGRNAAVSPAVLDVGRLTKFVDPLPIPPIAQPEASISSSISSSASSSTSYRISMQAIEHRAHRDLPPAQWWGYGGSIPGPTIETRSGQPVQIVWINDLPKRHLLPIDHHLHGAGRDVPDVRAIVHVHGARVPHDSDGYPENWYIPGQSRLFHYPNQQDAAMLWYHDHAMGINRLNIYAGMVGLFVIRDEAEERLNLPRGEQEIPLVLFDRFFDEGGPLYYPVSEDPAHPWIPELFGNALLVNGKLFPYLDVEPRRYRLRLLNAANGRFYHLSLSNRHIFHQIGTDQGLLPAPVPLQSLQLAPAERADLIVDFSSLRGEQVVLMDGVLPMMQFRVGRHTARDTSAVPARLRRIEPLPEASARVRRSLTLDEYDTPGGMPKAMLLNGARWHMPVTETPRLGDTEIWSLVNLTDDAHPIHLHLVRFQILDRRPFSVFEYATSGRLLDTGPAVPPGADEAGWKDTVRAYPGMVTRIIIRFDGYPGRYVWHCHILEHEANEMMRPYELLVPATSASTAERP